MTSLCEWNPQKVCQSSIESTAPPDYSCNISSILPVVGGLIDCHCCNLLHDRFPVNNTNKQIKKIQDNDKQLKATPLPLLKQKVTIYKDITSIRANF